MTEICVCKTKAAFAFMLIAMLTIGCGETETTWPSSKGNDWIKLVGGKGMANVWGIAIDVANVPEDAEISINPDATLGPTHNESSGKNIIIFGKQILTFEIDGKTNRIHVSINGRDFGKVILGQRIAIDEEGNVRINEQLRKPEE